MNILITGSNGFLGKSISHKISQHGDKVYGLSRSSGDFIVSLEKYVPDFHVQFDLVIHTAGKAHNVTYSDLEKNDFIEVNVGGTLNLIEGLNRSGLPKYFIFISSVAVYGLEEGLNICENAPLLALDPYGKSKIEAEMIILDWCKKNNILCTILRLPLIIGPNPPGNLGTMIKSLNKGYYFNIAGGKAKKSMVLLEDVANIISKVTKIGGIYNLTDGYHPSFEELSTLISIQLGKNKPQNIPFYIAKSASFFFDLFGGKVFFNSRKFKKITSSLTFDDTRAREVFGWDPTPVLKGFKL